MSETEAALTGKLEVSLSGIPETMLWPLWNRAAETKKASGLLEDPLAADLVERIDYDFAAHFGKPHIFHAIRARRCDDLIRQHIVDTSDQPTVVALGEGLETQFWRIADQNVRWFSVDLPEAIRLRRCLLPRGEQLKEIACSALDDAWLGAIPADCFPFISAAGLLMYFEERQVRDLLMKIAERFNQAIIFFDTIPPYLSKRTLSGWKITRHYQAPPMPWGIEFDLIPEFVRSIPGLEVTSLQSYGDAFPDRTPIYHQLGKIRPIRRRFAAGLVAAQVRA